MDTVQDFEDLLNLFARHEVRYLQEPNGLDFATAWSRRVEGRYGGAPASWIDLDSLIEIKSRIDHPRHQEDVRVLRMVRERRERDR